MQATRRMSTTMTPAALPPMTAPVLIERASAGVPADEQNMEYCSPRIHRGDM